MNDNFFDIVKINKTNEGKPYGLKIVDKKYRNMKVNMKWDGCIDLFTYSNGYTVDDDKVDSDNIDYIHICEVKEFIARLEEVVRVAEENFSKEDFENYWD